MIMIRDITFLSHAVTVKPADAESAGETPMSTALVVRS
jgi:hypothetical protein